METTEDVVHVCCPNCSNRRLFDVGVASEGIIRIKCPNCRAVAVINLRYVTSGQRRKRLEAYCKVASSNI